MKQGGEFAPFKELNLIKNSSVYFFSHLNYQYSLSFS